MEDIRGIPGSLIPTYVAPPVRFLEGPGKLAIRALRYEKLDSNTIEDAALASPIAKKPDDAMSYGIMLGMILDSGKQEDVKSIKWRHVHIEELYWGRNTKFHPMVELLLTKKQGIARDLPERVSARVQISSVVLHPGQILDTWISCWGEDGSLCGKLRLQLSFTPLGSVQSEVGGELAATESFFLPSQIRTSSESWLNLSAT